MKKSSDNDIIFRAKNIYVSPIVRGTASLLPYSALLAASDTPVPPDPISNSYVIEGQGVDSYFEEGDLGNTWN